MSATAQQIIGTLRKVIAFTATPHSTVRNRLSFTLKLTIAPSTMVWSPFCNGGSFWESEDEKFASDLSLHTPPPRIEHITSGDVIADALKNLSLEDRERVCEDMHGVSDAINETPEFVANSLSEMQDQLLMLQKNAALLSELPCHAIQLAEQQDYNFVNDPRLRLMFLRADDFHPRRAAARMIRFFDLKLFLFGESKLCKVITLDDLDPYDIAMIKKGYLQTLPQRDRTGRRVDVYIEVNPKWKSPESLVRINMQLRGIQRSRVRLID
jgi:hypothetical protein